MVSAVTNTPAEPPPSAPTPVRVAAGLLVCVAGVAVVLGILEAVNIRWHRAVVGVGATLLLFLYAVWLVVIARGLMRLRSWARGMAIATQVVLLPVAWSFRAAPTTWVAIVVAVVALSIIGCLLSPVANRVLMHESYRQT